jgi:hypothetical protein
MMRALVVYDIFKEVEEEIYEHSSLSLKLSTPPLRDSALPRGARALSGETTSACETLCTVYDSAIS